ncbi:hypothetical protein QYE76_035129 [Lolium multiflorum]|uniref:Reverse transcriptase domain-containing protein n=1 Tax=Lolium multiflorum TaxID=4521 RepID=A0AAD8R0A7_LOLMU|nr:hypothetical protein QYE76_035129 [Lolium multiflorum]
MVFILPSEFRAPSDEEVSVAQFDCGPRPVIFEKPRDRSYRHLKALYLRGYINGQPVSKMLVDTGAAVNIMPYSMLRRLGHSSDDMIKTKVTLSDFNGQASEAKGVLNVELTDLISENQSAFLPGRLISDNALIAFECFYHIQKNKRADDSYCAYKLDLSKANDRVDWNYLRCILVKMGFATEWVNKVMACVTSVKFAVKINGELTNTFAPSRGLRQGDPLSPYLFLFVAEGLSKLLLRAVYNQELLDLKCCRGAPGISHLFFADDSLLFFKASSQQATVIKHTIAQFERCTCQLLSSEKCSLMLNEMCPTETQEEIKSILGITQSTFDEKYLGLPTPEGRMKAEKFQPTKDRFAKRLSYRNEKLMSMAGISGGERKTEKGKFIGPPGIISSNRKTKAVWGLETQLFSTKLFLPAKLGD